MYALVITLMTGSVLLAADVVFHGKTVNIDLSDLEKQLPEKPGDEDIKRVCAGIITRYHDAGYTAFYITKSVIHDDGKVEIFFNESVVSGIFFSPECSASEIFQSAELFTEGLPFNEIVVRENVRTLRNRYRLSRLKVDVLRNDDGSVRLEVCAEKRRFSAFLSVSGDPLRGTIPSILLGYTGDWVYTGAEFSSSFGQGDATYTEAGLVLRDIRGDSGFTGRVGYTARKDSIDSRGSDFYTADSGAVRTGWYVTSGALYADIAFLLDAGRMKDYPGADGFEKYSAAASVNYDDRGFGLERYDYTLFRASLAAGWNTMERGIYTSGNLFFRMSVPLAWRFYGLVCADSFFTTENERLFSNYVFTGLVGCRKNDFTVSPATASGGLGVTCELMKEHIYLTPGIYGGVFKDEEGTVGRVWCAGFGIEWSLEVVSVLLNASWDMSGSGDRVYMIAARGSF